MEFLILVLVAFGFYKMNQKSNEYKETADKAQSQLDAYIKANQTAESIIKKRCSAFQQQARTSRTASKSNYRTGK